jgi:mRNA interferase MazF
VGTFTTKSIVLIPFPFSELSNTKLRPAVILASLEHGDYILCQITSKVYTDSRAVPINLEDYATGSLDRISYARPGKLFTANEKLLLRSVGVLGDKKFSEIREAVMAIFR